MNYNDAGYKILSCTTDGFLLHSDADFSMESVKKGVFGEVYQTALGNLGIDKFFLERKHFDDLGVLT